MVKYITIRVKSELDENIITIICDGVVITDDMCIEKITKWLKYAISNT